jgi:predicted dehydrogenase
MRVGIVGAGYMGRTHAASWARTPAIIVGFVSGRKETADSLAHEYHTRAHAQLDDLLADVDVVDICTPTHLHHEIALRAAAAGKHIICEKPLARTAVQAQEMIAACAAASVKLLPAHVVRFFPEYAAARAQVAAGAIGRPAVLRLTRGSSKPQWAAGNWLLDFEKSGGMMLDLMIHDFDYARWVAGDVVRVLANNVGHKHPQASADHALVILTHRNGAISHVEGSWAYPSPMFRTRFEIAGENGLIEFDSGQAAAIRAYLHEPAASDGTLPRSPLLQDPFTAQLNSFYDHIVHDTQIPVTALDGYKALEIALAAVESAQTGQPVTIEEGVL